MILLIDNYDSFVFNLARYFTELGQTVRVVRNDAISVTEVVQLKPAAIVLSPGPCTPNEAGIGLELVAEVLGRIPLLGVCLGHQTIAAAVGAKIVRAPEPMHGRTSHVQHCGTDLFAELPNPLQVMRYHSLVVEEATIPESMAISARTTDGLVMGITHNSGKAFGVQFHPESILTSCGYELLANFLQLHNLPYRARHFVEYVPPPELPGPRNDQQGNPLHW